MGRKYAIHDQASVYFVTFTVINWLDVFIRNEYRQIILDSLNYCRQHKGLHIHAYCIMTSHVHLILSVEEGFVLSDVIRDMKSHTSTQMKKAIAQHPGESRKPWLLWMCQRAGSKNKRNTDFQFWLQHNHPIELNTMPMIEQRLAYIHDNPVEAGFVDDPTAWRWSSCRAYETGIEGEVVIDYL